MHLADLLCALDVLISYYDDLTTRWETCFFIFVALFRSAAASLYVT